MLSRNHTAELYSSVTVPESQLSLQKVVWRFASHVWLALPRCRLELQKRASHGLINLHNCGHITAPITVIRGTEHSNHVLVLRITQLL